MFKYIQWGVTIFLLTWIFSQVDLKLITNVFTFDKIPLLTIIVFFFISSTHPISTYKLYSITTKLHKIPFTRITKATFIGLFLSKTVLPNLGKDVVEGYFIKKNTNLSWAPIFLILFLNRLTGFIAIILFAFFYLIFNSERLLTFFPIQDIQGKSVDFYVLLMLSVLLIFFSILLYLFRHKILRRKNEIIKKLKESSSYFDKPFFFYLVVLSSFFYIFQVLAFGYIIQLFEYDVYWYDLLFVLVISKIVTTLPISIGGIGVQETSIASLLSLFNIPLEIGSAIAIFIRILMIVPIAIGGAFMLFSEPIRYSEIKQEFVNKGK